MAILLEDFLAETATVKCEVCDTMHLEESSDEGSIVLEIVLHAIRNRLSVEEKVEFMSYLPSSLLAIFALNWQKIYDRPVPLANGDDLIIEIQKIAHIRRYQDLTDYSIVKDACLAVIKIILCHTDQKNIERLKKIIPKMD